MEFRCRLARATGDILEETHVADSEIKLRRDLEKKGLYILSLQPRGVLSWKPLTVLKSRRLGAREFIVFNQQLATLLRAGIPLVQSLDILRQGVEKPILQSVLNDVYEQVRSGTSLSDAFASHGAMFSGVYTASLLAGEKSGGLQDVLNRYVTYARIINGVKRKTLSTLLYPAILLLLSLTVVAIIVLRVVPEFGEFYTGMGAELPLATRAITALSANVRDHFLIITFVLLISVCVIWAWLKQPERSATIDTLVLRIPTLGSVISKFSTSQLTRTLATLLGGGIPLVKALDVTTRAIGNRHCSPRLETVATEVREGQSLSSAMSRQEIFPAVAIKMIQVGESSGALQDMLNSVADLFDEEIETTLTRFMTLLEPILLIIMGIVIAILLLALYMPLLQMGTVVQ